MKTKFVHKGKHECPAVVLTCIDFRFWKQALQYIEEELNIKDFDFPSLPGSAKAINESNGNDDLAMSCISVPCDLHHAKKVVIVNHEDCGAYGGSKKFNSDKEAEQRFHEQELKKAEAIIKAKYPNVDVDLIYARLTDDDENVEFLRVS